jgi:hypothetical protein
VQTDLITLTDYAHLPPLAGLSAHFRLPHVPASCEELRTIGESSLPEVLFLEALEELDAEQLPAWLRLIDQWSHTAHQCANRGEMFAALCVSAPAHRLAPLLAERVQLFQKVHYWWGLPTPAETQLLWHDIALKVADLHLARWRNHMLPSIAAGDTALLEQLATCEGRTDQITACLEQFAAQRGWTTTRLKQAGGDLVADGGQRSSVRQQQPGVAEEMLWSMGALIWTPEHGTELHPAALRPLGLQHELDHRIWRAQAALLLPLLDRVRLHICRQLTLICGPDWPWRYTEPLEDQEKELVRQNPMLCGLGHLAWLLHPQGKLRAHTQWHNLAAQARDVRNRIAHYQLVTLEEYLGIMQQIEQSFRRS